MDTVKEALSYSKSFRLSPEAKEQALKDTTWVHVRLFRHEQESQQLTDCKTGPQRNRCCAGRLVASRPLLRQEPHSTMLRTRQF